MNTIKFALLVLGMIFLVFGLFISANYAFRLNSDRDWGESQILYDLGFIGLGLAFELLGLGLIFLGNAVEQNKREAEKTIERAQKGEISHE